MNRKRIIRIESRPSSRQRIRIAAYCRVSSSREEQLGSLANQVEHYRTLINANPDWEFAGVYCDSGISGTSKEERPELNRLLNDCKAGRIDKVLTKSISRFARNTTDCLEMIRALSRYGVVIEFEKEHLSSEGTGGEWILSILASLAEEESRSISANCKWAVKKKFLNGTFKLSRAPYGYDLENGRLVINEAEAEVVRNIFDRVINGASTPSIARSLNDAGIPVKRRGKWQAGTIQRMIRNEIFTGDLLMQKTCRDEHYRPKANKGQSDQYLVHNHHPAIVSREVFDAAGAALISRDRSPLKKAEPIPDSPPPSNPLAGKMICYCKSPMKAQKVKRADGPHTVWACKRHLINRLFCRSDYIRQEDIENAFITMLNKLAFSRAFLLDPYIERLRQRRSFMMRGQLESRRDLQNQRTRLLGQFASGSIPVYDYYRQARLIEVKQVDEGPSPKELAESRALKEAEKLNYFIRQWNIGQNVFCEKDFIELSDHILVRPGGEIVFVLKCGLELPEKIIK